MAYIITKNIATCMINGKQYNIDKQHPNFDYICEMLRSGDYDEVLKYIDTKKAVESTKSFLFKNIESYDDTVLYNGVELDKSIAKRIVDVWNDNGDIDMLSNFLDNLFANPSGVAIKELYKFLEYGSMPITHDGHFLAYKKVRNDYMDIYSGTMDNSVSQVLSMPRNLVDDDRRVTCSNGLHFCSEEYLNCYGTNSQESYKVMILKINPRDVVAIPADYNDTKGRCCRYEVIGELSKDNKHVFDKFLVDDVNSISKQQNENVSDEKLTVRQKIALKVVEKYIMSIISDDDEISDIVENLYRDNRDVYEDIINELTMVFDKPITRDRAVRHYKFVKSYLK